MTQEEWEELNKMIVKITELQWECEKTLRDIKDDRLDFYVKALQQSRLRLCVDMGDLRVTIVTITKERTNESQ